jgi:hypothetical protein
MILKSNDFVILTTILGPLERIWPKSPIESDDTVLLQKANYRAEFGGSWSFADERKYSRHKFTVGENPTFNGADDEGRIDFVCTGNTKLNANSLLFTDSYLSQIAKETE